MWLEHLLLLSMLQHVSGTWTWGRYVVVHPAGNTDFADACARYRDLLADQSTFSSVTVEELLDANVLPAETTAALRDRYLPNLPDTPSSQYAMALRRIAVSLGLAAALLGCASSAGAVDAPPLRVLFVGNSLTATNDLPGRVAGLAAATGRRLEYEAITFGGFSLEDHWNQGDARAALATGRWNVVIMQQGPSALPESQVDLRLWAAASPTRPAP